MQKIDRTGRKYGLLTVMSEGGKRHGRVHWNCQCDCGNVCSVSGTNLQMNHTTSCGCVQSAVRRQTHSTHGSASGGTVSSELRSYYHAKERCRNPKCADYPRYGGRGIVMSEVWSASPAQFLADMGPKPTPGHTLERMDNNGPYSAENCRWATRLEQAHNRRRCGPFPKHLKAAAQQ